MTVLACDGVHVAADSMVTGGDQKFQAIAPKIMVFNDEVVGFFGTEGGKDLLLRWYSSGADPAQPPAGMGETWHLVVFRKKVATVYCPATLYGDKYTYPCAFGTGASYATGAMAAGATARNAVRIACKFSVTCGGKPYTLPLNQKVTKK